MYPSQTRIALLAILLALPACDDDSQESSAPSTDATAPLMDQTMSTSDQALADQMTSQDMETSDAQRAEDAAMILDGSMTPEPVQDAAPSTTPETVLGRALESCETIALLAPTLPTEAGHYAAKILTPTAYPFAIDGIQYALVSNEDVPTCSGAIAHRVMLFALDEGQTLPATPSANGLGYREYDVPAAPDALAGRQVDIEVPIPLILTEGQRVAVAIQFAVDNGRHPCVADCSDEGATPGTDWWSNAAEAPYAWQDLVADFGLSSQLLIRVTGSQVE